MRLLSLIVLLLVSTHASADYIGTMLNPPFGTGSGSIVPQGEIYPKEILESIAVLEEQFSASEHTRLVFSIQTFKSHSDKYALNVRICSKGNVRSRCFHEATTTVNFIPDRLGLLLREVYLSTIPKDTLVRMAQLLKNNRLEVIATLKRATPWYKQDETLQVTRFDFMSTLQSGEFVTVLKRDQELVVGLQFQN